MDIDKLTKKVQPMHFVIAIGLLVGLYFMGVLPAFFGAVVADEAVETATCRISGETWSPDTLKCQCPVGMGYEFGEVPEGGQAWTCVPLATSETASVTKPEAAPKESPYTGKNVMLGIAIIMGAILVAFLMRKKN